MEPDDYCDYLVQNVYLDTNNWDVISTSIDKPTYKEKMRLRCYGVPNADSNIFLELKKKHMGIVYKRRITLPFAELLYKPLNEIVSEGGSQICKELDFYIKTNMISEKIYIAYRRTAFAGIYEKGLRITFDTDIRFRMDDLNFTSLSNGHLFFPDDCVIMEIKTLGAMPIWLAHTLSECEIYPTSISKYGVCYTNHILGITNGLPYSLQNRAPTLSNQHLTSGANVYFAHSFDIALKMDTAGKEVLVSA
jgi:hypothetical protein